MTMTTLGRLQQVDIREIWKNESWDFTPWLAEPDNIRLLGDTIGVELEVESVEKEVGRFYADILCKETSSDRYVVVENQIEKTDHDHLGKTITYASGLGATAVVWIAKHFTDEHRAALDWLNEITNADVAFFGLEIEAWRIGDSPAAPKFNVVCRPNDFTTAEPPGELSPTGQAQLDFWLAFKEFMEESSSIKCSKPAAQTWMNHPIGRSGVWIASILSTWDSATNKQSGELRVELGIDDGHARATFAALGKERETIEAALHERVPDELIWHSKEDVRACKLYVRQAEPVLDRDRWPEYREWLRTRLEAFDSVFRPILADIVIDA
jgi:hypothetical protein